MANPQLENGFTMLANEILEALMKIRIPGQAWQVLLVIIRKTYGFKKKTDYISLSQFQGLTGLVQPHVCRSVNTLVGMNLIIKKDKHKQPTYRFNKDYDTWIPLPKKIRGIKKDNQGVSKKVDTKETPTKDIKRSPAPPDLVEKRVSDGTHGDKCDAIILACKSYLDLGCTHAQAGQINKKAESVGQAIVAIRRIKKWIDRGITTKRHFMGAVIRDLKESRGSTDAEDKHHPGWPDADWDSVKQQNDWFEKDLDKKYGNKLGDVIARMKGETG